jgi:hypothetical protein
MTTGFASASLNALVDSLTSGAYLQFHTADPGAAGTSNIAAGAARLALTHRASVCGGAVQSGTASASWTASSATLTHGSVWSASSGGTFRYSLAFTTPRAVISGDTYSLRGMTLSVTQSAALILDTIPAAAAAYSLRRLRSLYTGSAIRVRRSSDNTESDIGFTASGDLNTSALTTFVGANNGFIVTWYDQSGNARNVTNATQSEQPQIVSSGTVLLLNTRPAPQFAMDMLTVSGITGAPSRFGVSMVANAEGSSSWQAAAGLRYSTDTDWQTLTSAVFFEFGADSSTIRPLRNGDLNGVANPHAPYVAYTRYDATQVTTGVNELTYSQAFAEASLGSPLTLHLGSRATGAASGVTGRIAEFIYIPSDMASSIDTLRADQSRYYGIYIG